MCGRFVLKNAEQIPLRFDATADDAVRAALADRFNSAPTAPVPVVVEEPSGARQVAIAAWGIALHRPGGRPFLAFNARAESLTERQTFRPLVARSRCLVPASGWYEWTAVAKSKAKQPWYITAPDAAELLGLAGLLDRWIDRDGTPRAACAIVTTGPPLPLPPRRRAPAPLARLPRRQPQRQQRPRLRAAAQSGLSGHDPARGQVVIVHRPWHTRSRAASGRRLHAGRLRLVPCTGRSLVLARGVGGVACGDGALRAADHPTHCRRVGAIHLAERWRARIDTARGVGPRAPPRARREWR